MDSPAKVAMRSTAVAGRPPRRSVDAAATLVPAADLAAILRELRELRAAVAPELDARCRLLAALRSSFGDSLFAAVDVLESALVTPNGDLARAVALVIGEPAGGLRRMARRMAKLAGRPAGGFVLRRVGSDREGALYVVQTLHWTA
ncbi:MAG: hypothetical protein IT521_02015 [Burkholderiales bacterium]|nr:hypothetical protein [Burkholderiales bacterium]